MKTKTFDCVEMKRRAAEQILPHIQGKSVEEQLDYWREREEEWARERMLHNNELISR